MDVISLLPLHFTAFRCFVVAKRKSIVWFVFYNTCSIINYTAKYVLFPLLNLN